MAIYYSVQEMFDANLSNMTALINNSVWDDGTYSLQGPDFMDNMTIYVSGNSWFGFGSSTEMLKVNRRDTKMYYLYSESGMVNSTKFFKLRWSGYSYYSDTSSGAKQEYDVVLWEDRSISLRMVTIPTVNNTGYYTFTPPTNSTTYSYQVSNDNPHATFKYDKNTGNYEVSNEIIFFSNPLCLIKYQNNYYSWDYDENDNLIPLLLEGDLIELFQEWGTPSLPLEIFKNFTDFQVVVWEKNSDYELPSFSIYGIPYPQILEYDSINIKSNNGLDTVGVTGSNNVIFQVSPDGGQSWKYYNSEWISSNTFDDGMTSEVINSLTQTEWSEFLESENCIFRVKLESEDASAGNIYIKYVS